MSPGAEAWPSPHGPRNSGQSARAAGPPMTSSITAIRKIGLSWAIRLGPFPQAADEFTLTVNGELAPTEVCALEGQRWIWVRNFVGERLQVKACARTKTP